jgi:hypothetical protein
MLDVGGAICDGNDTGVGVAIGVTGAIGTIGVETAGGFGVGAGKVFEFEDPFVGVVAFVGLDAFVGLVAFVAFVAFVGLVAFVTFVTFVALVAFVAFEVDGSFSRFGIGIEFLELALTTSDKLEIVFIRESGDIGTAGPLGLAGVIGTP